MTTVVLGWDALDAELASQFDLRERFGPHTTSIETFENEQTGSPLTREVWPSIITGVSPEEHGIRAVDPDSGVEWENPVLDVVSTFSQNVVPHSVRKRIGSFLRDRGTEVAEKDRAYYRNVGVSTVFDERRSRAIAVPNFRSPRDAELDISTSRKQLWVDVIETREDESTYEPLVPEDVLDERLRSLATERLGYVRSCVARDYDIVFCWLAFLDSVGHLAPLVDEGGWQERMYREAAQLTDDIRELLLPDDTLVCVSDHGLRDGAHTPDAFLGSDDDRVLEGVESVLDVREGLERVTPSRSGSPSDVREQFRCESASRSASVGQVEENLKDLGYL